MWVRSAAARVGVAAQPRGKLFNNEQGVVFPSFSLSGV